MYPLSKTLRTYSTTILKYECIGWGLCLYYSLIGVCVCVCCSSVWSATKKIYIYIVDWVPECSEIEQRGREQTFFFKIMLRNIGVWAGCRMTVRLSSILICSRLWCAHRLRARTTCFAHPPQPFGRVDSLCWFNIIQLLFLALIQ